MNLSIQDIINFILAGASLTVAILAYEDKGSINGLKDIAAKQNTTNDTLSFQLASIREEAVLLQSEVDILRNQDISLTSILKKLDLQTEKLKVELSLNKGVLKDANDLALQKRKSEDMRLIMLDNEFIQDNSIGFYALQGDTALIRKFLLRNKPLYEECLQNSVLLENSTLVNMLLNIRNRNYSLYEGLDRTLETFGVTLKDKDGKDYEIKTEEELRKYKKDDFYSYCKQHEDFVRKLSTYVYDVLNQIR